MIMVFLVALGALIRIEGRKLATTAANIPLALDIISQSLHMTTIPEGFDSIEHLMQEATIWLTVFGFRVSLEKLLSETALPILP